MNPVFQYITATLIVVLTLSFTLYQVTALSTVQLNSYSQLQLIPIANSLMQDFVLSPGAPLGWGSNTSILASNLSDFGLANPAGRGSAYSLDPFALNRIVNNSLVNNTLYIPPTTAGRLLGIYQLNHFNYGFDFRMVPALNITISGPVNSGTSKYNITVLDYNGLPAINANVNVTYYAFWYQNITQGNKNIFSYGFTSTSSYNVTDLKGRTQVTLTQPSIPSSVKCNQGNSQKNGVCGYLIVAGVNYYGIKFQNIFSGNVCKSQMIILGQYLIAKFDTTNNNKCYDINGNPLSTNNGAVFPSLVVFAVTSNLGLVIDPAVSCSSVSCSLLNKGAQNTRVFQLQSPLSASVVFAGLMVTTNGRDFFVVASNPSTATGYIEYTSSKLTTVPGNAINGLGIAKVPAAVTVSRFVTVGSNTWFATLTVWRMGQS